MRDRLLQFLQLEQLSPAKFADILGVQRSGVSHILSGRNKPGFDFIEKVLIRFPAVNAEWLITGKAKMYKEQYAPTPAPDLFSAPPQASIFPVEPLPTPAPVPASASAPVCAPALSAQTIAEENNHFSAVSALLEPVKQGVKQVAKIVIFYTDKTFGEYLPE
ncbi:MAG: hypothetical protein FWE30_07340 [Bacteroidales bacterium]|nr:hypothetical protein [Bacteroidales bacterium]MCL2739245.1 hypothetical protein [Bacteroidales bacterium]